MRCAPRAHQGSYYILLVFSPWQYPHIYLMFFFFSLQPNRLYIPGWVNWFLSNWKSHQIVSWKLWCHGQTAAGGSWFRADCLSIDTWWRRTDTQEGQKKRFNIAEKHTQTNITTKWQMSQSPAPQTLLSSICKWAHRPILPPCSPSFLRTPKRWSQPPIRADKMSDEVIGSDGMPNDRWQDETRRGWNELRRRGFARSGH